MTEKFDAKKQVNTQLSDIEKKLQQMLKDLPVDEFADDSEGCGHGCDHKHHR